jgi:hypothetical protein
MVSLDEEISKELRSIEEKPTSAIIDNHRSRLSEIWTGAHKEWKLDDDYYFRRYDVWDDPVKRRKRPSWLRPARPTSIIDHAVDHQLASEPQVHREPIHDNEESQKRASKVEQAVDAIFQEASLQEPVLSGKATGKYLVHLGYSVLEFALDSPTMLKRRSEPERENFPDGGEGDDEFKAAMRVFETRKLSMMPFRIRVPHPARVLMDPWSKRPPLAIRHYRRTAQELEDITRLWRAMGRDVDQFYVKGNKPYELLMVDEWWTETWHAMKISGRFSTDGRLLSASNAQMLFNIRNSWQFVPYAHGFAGFGIEQTMETKVDPKDLAVGLLRSVRADLKAQAQSVNARHHSVIDGSYRPVLVSGMSAEEFMAQFDESDAITMDGSTATQMEIPRFDRRMFEEERWISDDIEDGTFSRVLAGKKEPGISTVGQQVILSSAAGKKFVSVARQQEHLYSTIGSYALQTIDAFDMVLRIRGKSIRSSDLEGDYNIQVTFNHVDPVVQMQNKQIGMQEVQAGLKSRPTYWSADAMLEDQAGEETRLIRDWILSQPMIHQELALIEARNMGVEELLLRAIDREKKKREGQSQLVDPQGRPIASGQDDLNQGLTGETLNPNRTGAELAG